MVGKLKVPIQFCNIRGADAKKTGAMTGLLNRRSGANMRSSVAAIDSGSVEVKVVLGVREALGDG